MQLGLATRQTKRGDTKEIQTAVAPCNGRLRSIDWSYGVVETTQGQLI